MEEQRSPLPVPRSALSVLCRADAATVKSYAETLLESINDVQVQKNATGLVLLPMQDSVRGGPFLLGEVLVAESQVQVGNSVGYAVVLGRDLEHSLAVALLDAASRLPDYAEQVRVWTGQERSKQIEADDLLLREIEATRVEMETF